MISKIPEENKNSSGVYVIKNLINNKIYIGSTNNFDKRYRYHLGILSKGKSKSHKLQASINKYGIENFEFSILHICDNYIEIEDKCIKEQNPELNIIKGATIGHLMYSEESRKKQSDTMRSNFKSGKIIHHFLGKNLTEEHKAKLRKSKKGVLPPNTTPVDLYDLEGNLVYSFESVNEAARQLKISYTAAQNAVRGKCSLPITKQYIWKLKKKQL